MKKIKLLLIPLMLMTVLTSCGGGTNTPPVSENPPSVKQEEFSNVIFEDVTVDYDGNPHILGEVRGAPSGTKITYSGREEKIDVGVYKATAKLEKENYQTKELEAELKILPIDFSELSYDDVMVIYDGKDHIGDVQLTGFPPEGTTVKQTVKNQEGSIVTSAVEVGSYHYSIEISNKNYNKLTLNATLSIVAKRTDMPVFSSSDGNIYFANGLDHGFLYSFNPTEELSLIDYSTPKEFNSYSSSTALFISKSPILNSVKEFKDGMVNVLYTDSSIDDFVKYNETVYYYASNSFTEKKSGIYKVDATDTEQEPIVTKIFEGKSDNLSIYQDELYFTNKNDNDYLYKINLSTFSLSLVMEKKAHEYIIDHDKLYCAVNETLNDYIAYIDLKSDSTTPTKLTNIAGEFLKIRNGNLYFYYSDWFSYVDASKLGVWRMNLSTNVLTQVLAKQVNGFDLDSEGNIFYIDRDDLHLYRYHILSKNTVDLLDGFVAPEVVPLNTGGKTITYESKVYYLNMYAGKTLYMYDEKTKQNMQLTMNKVEDFIIHEGFLYFNLVTMFTNNDLYCVDLKMGREAIKINTNDVRNMTIDGVYLYATHYNWAGVSGGMSRMKLDGSEYMKFSEVNGAKNLTMKDGKLYFINCGTGQDNGYIEYYSIKDIKVDSAELVSTRLSEKIKNVKQFIFDGNQIFYIYNGLIENSIRRSSFTSLDEGVAIASSKTNPNEMILKGDEIYYYSYATSAVSSAGFYKVNKNAVGDKTQQLILGYDSTYYGSSLAISENGYLYFLNYIPKMLLGNAHTYQLCLETSKVLQIDS